MAKGNLVVELMASLLGAVQISVFISRKVDAMQGETFTDYLSLIKTMR
jgi:hypothetical protein